MDTKVIAAFSLTVLVAFNAEAANTMATVQVENKTANTAVYGYEYFSGSVSPAPVDIAPGQATSFVLTSVSDSVSGMRFTYASGSKKCKFEASHTVNFSTKVPTFTRKATSVGTTYATCTATAVSALGTSPYNYTVLFSIK